MSILLCTQGTYPFYGGGVTMWCDTLIRGLPQFAFDVYAITGHSSAKIKNELAPNVNEFIHVPMWGLPDPAQYFLPLRSRRKMTTPQAIESQFLPKFATLLDVILSDQTPTEVRDSGQAIYELWDYFQTHDWNSTWQSEDTWRCFVELMTRAYESDPAAWQTLPSLQELATALQLFQHYMTPLAVPLPDVEVIHNTCAGHTGLVGVIAKHARNTPFIVTEHGVLIREQYIFIGQDQQLTFNVKAFIVRLNGLLCKLNYQYADVICPVSNFNIRWEVQYGASTKKIRTIYNGIDTDLFLPKPKPPETAHRPTVVAATRVIPLKDIETMIRSAAIVRESVPDVLYMIFGSLDAVPTYVEICRKLIADLGLQDHFIFAGHSDKAQDIYNYGDISILSSISEGFPLTILESMSCERPVVSTDVGGVREILEGCGMLVPVTDFHALAKAITKLLSNDEMRLELGRRSRQRVMENYPIQMCLNRYQQLYERAMDRKKS